MTCKIILFYLLITFAGIRSLDSAAAEYWISFTSFEQRLPGPSPGGPKYVMKIDVLGNVLIPPTQVVPNSAKYESPSDGATAISSTDRVLHLWMATGIGVFNVPIFHAVIDKHTLSLVSLRKMNLRTAEDGYLQVTHKKEKNFLAVQRAFDPPREDTQWYAGIPLGPNGKRSGSAFRLFLDAAGCISTIHSCPIGISSDGRVAFFRNLEPESSGISKKGFVVQKLDTSGDPVGQAVVVVKGEVIPVDVTNRLQDNRRFALYQVHVNNPSLFIQVIQGDTLTPIGDPIRVAVHTDFGSQTAAVDPKGRFVIYRRYRLPLLLYQALDVLGRPSGNPGIIANNASTGVDLVKD